MKFTVTDEIRARGSIQAISQNKTRSVCTVGKLNDTIERQWGRTEN